MSDEYFSDDDNVINNTTIDLHNKESLNNELINVIDGLETMEKQFETIYYTTIDKYVNDLNKQQILDKLYYSGVDKFIKFMKANCLVYMRLNQYLFFLQSKINTC